MNNAQVLFDKLTVKYIQEEMLGQSFENNWLECKQKDRPEQNSVDQVDKSHFAKALSGFANTAGGVLIFGLNARKEEGVDIIQNVVPIKNIRKFESSLRELESRLVERLVHGVEYKTLFTGDDEGIIVTYIPQSAIPPHRSSLDNKFYIRAGGTFQSLDINLIEDLFHRRRTPNIEFIIKCTGKNQFMICVSNTGEATAQSPYIVFEIHKSFSPHGWELDGNTRLSSWIHLTSYKGKAGSYWAFQAGNTKPIHPGSEVPLMRIEHQTGELEGRSFAFQYYLYAENMPSKEGVAILKDQ